MISDTKATFEHALKERGYWLARGDSKSYVAIELRQDSERYHDMGNKDHQRSFPNAPNAKSAFDNAKEPPPSKADQVAEARRQFSETRRALSDRRQEPNLDRER